MGLEETILTAVDVHLVNIGTGENNIITTVVVSKDDGSWDSELFTDGFFSCDCCRSELLYNNHPYYALPCNGDEANLIIIEQININGYENATIYKEEILDKEQKIMKEINDLTPYLSELQEFKQRGLFLPAGVGDEANKPRPIFDGKGKRIDSKATKKEGIQKAKERQALLNVKALKMRVMEINKWLDDRFNVLLPKWALKSIRKWPQTRPFILKMFFINVDIVHRNRPRPFGTDIITIKCFWAVYDEVKLIWE